MRSLSSARRALGCASALVPASCSSAAARRAQSSSAASAVGSVPAFDPNDALPSFSRALFGGRLLTASVVPYPRPPEASREALRELVATTETFYSSGANDPAANDATASIPEKTRAGLREFGAYGMQVPQEFGGIGADNASYGRLSEVLGGADLGLSIHLGCVWRRALCKRAASSAKPPRSPFSLLRLLFLLIPLPRPTPPQRAPEHRLQGNPALRHRRAEEEVPTGLRGRRVHRGLLSHGAVRRQRREQR